MKGIILQNSYLNYGDAQSSYRLFSVITLKQLDNLGESTPLITNKSKQYIYRSQMLDYSLSKHTPEQLRSAIIHEPIPKPTYPAKQLATTLHYSLCKKQSTTISFITNQRLLILNQAEGSLYYINETVGSPFKFQNKVPKPKNEAAFISFCIAKREGGDSSTLIVTFNKKGAGDKPKLECVEWRFTFESRKLAQQWEELIKEKKLERMARAIGVDTKDKKTLNTINDTISFALVPQQGSNIKKQEDEDEAKERKDMGDFFMNINVHKPAEQNSKKQFEANYNANSPQSSKNQRNSNSSPKNAQNKYLKSLVIQQVDQQQTQNRTVRSPKNAYNGNDWNLKFIHNRTEQTIKQFQQYALKQFLSLNIDQMKFTQEEGQTGQIQKPIILIQNNLNIFVAPICSQIATFLKQQFSNYNYIVQSCQENSCIGVPLACLIEYRGVVCLVKASFSEQAKIVDMGKNMDKSGFGATIQSLFRQLQTYTKIRAHLLRQSSVILNLAIPYGLTEQGIPRIYIDQISEYLPYAPRTSKNRLPMTQKGYSQLVRPELILDNFTRIISADGSEPQTAEQLEYYTQQSINQLAQLLMAQQQVSGSLADLEQLMNYYGLNLSSMPGLYYTIDIRSKKQAQKSIKKLLQSAMAALYVHVSEVEPVMGELRAAGKTDIMEDTLEGIFRKYCEGGAAIHDQSWKKLTLQFKKHYQIPLMSHQVEPAIFLSSLMHLLPAEYDLSKLDKTKKMFKQRPVILLGFLKQLRPRISSYNNFTSADMGNIMKLCQNKFSNNLARIESMYRTILEDQKIREEFLLGRRRDKFYAYMSHFVSPFDTSYQQLSKQIYSLGSQQPVTLVSHQIALNYLKHLCLALQSNPSFPEPFLPILESTLSRTSYWLSSEHPFICSLHDQLAQYHYHCLHQYEPSISLMKESLILSRRVCGPRNVSTASRYHNLGARQMDNGYRREARENLLAARDVLEDGVDRWIEQYAVVLNKLARLELADGHLDAAIVEAGNSNRKLERIRMNKSTHGYLALSYVQINSLQIDNYTILARACEVLGSNSELKKVALQIGKLLNRECNPLVFDQLLRICLGGLVFSLPDQKLQKLKQFMQYSKLCTQQQQQLSKSVDEIRSLLMLQAQNVAIIDKLNSRLQHIDRITDSAIKLSTDVKPQPYEIKQFRVLWQSIVDCTGGNQQVMELIQDFQEK